MQNFNLMIFLIKRNVKVFYFLRNSPTPILISTELGWFCPKMNPSPCLTVWVVCRLWTGVYCRVFKPIAKVSTDFIRLLLFKKIDWRVLLEVYLRSRDLQFKPTFVVKRNNQKLRQSVIKCTRQLARIIEGHFQVWWVALAK